jgi:hypothetical protein
MPLLDLKSNLKSLKYGQDRPGGGNSGQPYIQNNINNPKDILGFDDGLVRGGAVGAVRASLKDTVRIGKWLKDFSKGPLWIVKQVGLQRSNSKLETLPGAGGFFGEPTRLYNLGLNTLAQVPVNAFGVHFNRHGLTPIQSETTKYLVVAQRNNQGEGAPNNRLVKLKTQLISSASAPPSITTKLLSKASSLLSKIGIKIPGPKYLTIYDYDGGPGSVYGLGRTLIKRYADTNNATNKIPILDTKGITNIKANYQYNTPISTAYGAPTNPNNLNQNVIPYTDNIPAGANGTADSPTLRKYAELRKEIESRTTGSIFTYNPWKKTDLGISGRGDNYSNEISNWTNNKISYNNGLTKININGNWSKFNREQRIGDPGVNREDRINATPILKNVDSVYVGDGGTNNPLRDLVNLRILAVNGNNPLKADLMAFRALITQFSDSVDAKWNSVQYIGRGEEFYIYNGFGRKVQVGFKVATFSSQEMEFVYQKLNYLMSNLMPDYSGTGLMRGPFVKMTVGNWFNNQDGILNSLSYTIPNDSPWEIAIDEPEQGSAKRLLVLPHIVEVSLTFTPIGSQAKGVNKISSKSSTISHIAQNNDYQYIK